MAPGARSVMKNLRGSSPAFRLQPAESGRPGAGGMKAIVRRVGRLEGRLAPRENAASQRAAALLRERRRLRMEASGQLFEIGHRTICPPLREDSFRTQRR